MFWDKVNEKINIAFCLQNQSPHPEASCDISAFICVGVTLQDVHSYRFNSPNTDIQGFAVSSAVKPYTIRTSLHFSLFLDKAISYAADEGQNLAVVKPQHP